MEAVTAYLWAEAGLESDLIVGATSVVSEDGSIVVQVELAKTADVSAALSTLATSEGAFVLDGQSMSLNTASAVGKAVEHKAGAAESTTAVEDTATSSATSSTPAVQEGSTAAASRVVDAQEGSNPGANFESGAAASETDKDASSSLLPYIIAGVLGGCVVCILLGLVVSRRGRKSESTDAERNAGMANDNYEDASATCTNMHYLVARTNSVSLSASERHAAINATRAAIPDLSSRAPVAYQKEEETWGATEAAMLAVRNSTLHMGIGSGISLVPAVDDDDNNMELAC